MKLAAAVIALLVGIFVFTDILVSEELRESAIVEPADQRAIRCGESFVTGWMRGDDSGTLVAVTGDHTVLGENKLIPDDSPLVKNVQMRGLLCINLSGSAVIDCGTYEEVIAGTGLRSSGTSATMTPVQVDYRYFAGDETVSAHDWASVVKNGCPRQIEKGSTVEVRAMIEDTHTLRREALEELQLVVFG